MVGSIRKVPDGEPSHSSPYEFSTNISLSVIPKGTFVAPSGDWQYTFVCAGCLGRTDAYPGTAAKETFAWAVSVDKLTEPANKAGRLHHHHGGSGRFTVGMADARQEKYAVWAKDAVEVK
jgi:hypothetical protein